MEIRFRINPEPPNLYSTVITQRASHILPNSHQHESVKKTTKNFPIANPYDPFFLFLIIPFS